MLFKFQFFENTSQRTQKTSFSLKTPFTLSSGYNVGIAYWSKLQRCLIHLILQVPNREKIHFTCIIPWQRAIQREILIETSWLTVLFIFTPSLFFVARHPNFRTITETSVKLGKIHCECITLDIPQKGTTFNHSKNW